MSYMSSLLLASDCQEPPRADDWQIDAEGLLVLLVYTTASALIISTDYWSGRDEVCGV